MRTTSCAAVLLALACLAGPSAGRAQQEEAGTVVAIEGEVQIHRGSAVLSAKIKDPVYPRDLIRTSRNGRIKIFFDRSATITTIAEDSDVTITESYYRGARWKGLFSLGGGRIRLDIEEAFGKDVSVVTPNAIAGTKGTSFIVRYDAREESSTLLVLRGSVSFGNKASQILLGADQWSVVRGLRAPEPAAAATEEVKARETFQLRTKASTAPGGVSEGEFPIAPPGRNPALDGARNRPIRDGEKLPDNPQVDALTQTGAFILPGPLAVAPDVKPAPPAPPRPPAPPKPVGPKLPPDGGPGPI